MGVGMSDDNTVPNFWLGGTMFKVVLFLGPQGESGHWIPEAIFGGHTMDDVRKLLRMIGTCYATRPGAEVRVQIWDPIRQQWAHPSPDVTLRPEWDGTLSVEMDVRAGSWRG